MFLCIQSCFIAMQFSIYKLFINILEQLMSLNILLICICFLVLEIECNPIKQYSKSDDTIPKQQFKKNESISIKMLSKDNTTDSDADMLVEVDHDYELVSEETRVLSAVVNDLPDKRKMANIFIDTSTQLSDSKFVFAWPEKTSFKDTEVLSSKKISKDKNTEEHSLKPKTIKIDNSTSSKMYNKVEQSTIMIFINRPKKFESTVKTETTRRQIISDKETGYFLQEIALKGVEAPVYILKSSSNDSVQNISASPSVRNQSYSDKQSPVNAFVNQEDTIQRPTIFIQTKDSYEHSGLSSSQEDSKRGVQVPASFFELGKPSIIQIIQENTSESSGAKTSNVKTANILNFQDQSTIKIVISRNDKIKLEGSEIRNKETVEPNFSANNVIELPASFLQVNTDFGESLKGIFPFKNSSKIAGKTVPIIFKV